MEVPLCLKCGVVECNLNYGLFSKLSSLHPGCVKYPLVWPFVCANLNWYNKIKERNNMIIWCSGIYGLSLILIIHDHMCCWERCSIFLFCREWLCHGYVRTVQSQLIWQWTLPHSWASVVWFGLHLQFGWWRRTYWSLRFCILRSNRSWSTMPAVPEWMRWKQCYSGLTIGISTGEMQH